MGSSRFLVAALTLAFSCLLIAPASAQPGLLNIDCGSTQNTTDYYFKWVTDTGYISTGYNSGPIFFSGLESTFRYFNDSRRKHCYALPTSAHTTYLVRASFVYGNFSELYGNITFDLTLNATFWATVNIEPVVDWRAENLGVEIMISKEAIVRSEGSWLHVCLVRKKGLPFINSLQLRTLADNMYEEAQNDRLLVLISRWSASDWGSFRYPDDKYDREWDVYSSYESENEAAGVKMYAAEEQSLRVENTTEVAESLGVNRPPVYGMKYSYIWNETTEVGWFCLSNFSYSTGSYYTALYFQEIDELANATSKRSTRSMSVALQGVAAVSADVTVTSEVSIISTAFETEETSFNFTFTKAEKSRLGPLFNLLELYALYPMDYARTADEDVTALAYLQARLRGIGEWNGDPCHPAPWDWLTCNDAQPARVTQIKLSNYWLRGEISANITLLTELTDIWLQDNLIHGRIPDFGFLLKLKTIHLQNNTLEGSIPAGLATLPALEELFVQNNNLSGTIPAGLLTPRNGVNFSFVYDGNEFLQDCLPNDGPCLPSKDSPPVAPAPESSKDGVKPAIIAGAAAGAAALVLLAVVVFCCFCRKKPSKSEAGSAPIKDGSSQLQARVFSLADIASITSNFEKRLGQGSFGPVYYGRLTDGQEVAVKVNAADSSQGTEEFVNEVVLLSRVHHKYLVSLVGYCEAPQQHILVYAFMPNGTLTEHLHGDKAKIKPLTWMQRLDIALNAAQGLEYLHNFCNPPIIHRDIKPSNILLDNNLMAKVADFGMSKSAPEESRTGFSTAVKGTFGYLDPEYLSGWRLTTKSDVYSFGVILLELITGRKPTALIHFADGTQGNFMGWARSAQKSGDIQSIVDPDMGGRFSSEAMWKVAEMAWASVESQSSGRPEMGEIVRGLMEAIRMENEELNPKARDLDQRDYSYASSRASDSSSAPLNSYSSVSAYDQDMGQYYQPR